jgi:teichuronic acid exporter
MDDPKPSLARIATRSALWTGFSQYLLFGIGIVKTFLLFRLIDPEYFGLLAVAGVWSSYFAVARLELRIAVYSSKEEAHVLGIGFLLENASMLTGFVLAALAAWLWPNLLPAAAWPLIFILLGSALFETLSATPMYLAEKRLRQDVLSRYTVFASLIGFVIPVLLALGGASLAALVVDLLIPLVVVRGGAWLFTRWQPRLVWDAEEFWKQWRLGWTLWTTGLFGKITFQFDDFLVGTLNLPRIPVWKGAGLEPEGLYSKAYNTGKMPMDVAAGMIGSIALSLYAESASRGREVLVAVYRQLTWLLTWIIFFSSAVGFVIAGDIIYILGDQWVPMVPLFQLMILFVVGRPLFQNNSQLLLAMRAESDFQRVMLAQAIFLLIICPLAVYLAGAAGASIAVSGMSIIGFYMSERYVANHLEYSAWKIYIVPGIAAVIAIALSFVLTPYFPPNNWLAAVIKGVISLVVFGAALLLFERTTALEAIRTLRNGLKRG